MSAKSKLGVRSAVSESRSESGTVAGGASARPRRPQQAAVTVTRTRTVDSAGESRATGERGVTAECSEKPENLNLVSETRDRDRDSPRQPDKAPRPRQVTVG